MAEQKYDPLTRTIECLEALNKRPRPCCRDCADHGGVCPSSGLDCNMTALISNARAQLSRLQAGGGVVVAWQASDGGHSFISHRTHTTNPDYRAVYTIPLCVATPQPEPAPVAATSAMVPLTDAEWLEYLLKHADLPTLDLAAFRGESIQNRGLWVLRVQANDLRKLVERAHGIGLTVGDGGANG